MRAQPIKSSVKRGKNCSLSYQNALVLLDKFLTGITMIESIKKYRLKTRGSLRAGRATRKGVVQNKNSAREATNRVAMRAITP